MVRYVVIFLVSKGPLERLAILAGQLECRYQGMHFTQHFANVTVDEIKYRSSPRYESLESTYQLVLHGLCRLDPVPVDL